MNATRKPTTVTWADSTIDQLSQLRPDDILTLADGTAHKLGTVTFDRIEDSGVITRAAAFSLTSDRWINLVSGTVVRVEGDA